MSPAAAAEKFGHDLLIAPIGEGGLIRETVITEIANWFLARKQLIDIDRLGRILDEDGPSNPKTRFRVLKWANASNAEIRVPASNSSFKPGKK